MIARASVRTQLLLLGLMASVGLVIVLIAEHEILTGARSRFDQEQGETSVRRAREALGRAIVADRRRITETAWWNEAYEFMERPDGPVSRQFLKESFVDWLPSQYGDEYIGIWRADRTRRFRWAAPGSEALDTLLVTEALFNRLDERRSAAGLLPIDGRLYFITGAVILPISGDAEGARSRGYLITVRQVGPATLQDLSLTLQEDVGLSPAGDGARDNTTRVIFANGDSVSTAFLVPNFFERRAVRMELRSSRSFLADLEEWTRRFMLVVVGLSIALLTLAAVLARRLVVQPFIWLSGEFRRMRVSGQLTRLPEGPRPALDWTLLIEQFNRLADAREASERDLALARDAALEATRAKSDFLANMSHEIRTPMNAIIGFADLMRQSELAPEQREFNNLVLGSAESLLHLINDILDLSKVEAGRVVLETLPFNLHRAVGETMMLFAPRAKEKGVALQTSIAHDVPRFVAGDAARLRQVLVNLIGNALKFTSHGEVRLGVELAGGDTGGLLRFRVSDTGIGIPPEKIGSIFEKFTQADASTARKFGGTGLGLTICRELVRLMHGELKVESEVGKGSCFSFTTRLPETAEVQEIEPVSAGAEPMAGRRVLVVDDNEMNRIVGIEYLRRLGCEVEVVVGGQEAVDRVGRGGLDIVFMDCQMPGVDGYEATRAIRALGGELSLIRIVAMTANAMSGDREKCLAAGMDDYISKPIRAADLAASLRRADSVLPERAVSLAPVGPISPVDTTVLRQLAGSTEEGLELVGKLIGIFQRDAGSQIANLQRGVAERDWIGLVRHAHSLKGIAGTLGARRLSEIADRLESAGRSKDRFEADAAVVGLAEESEEAVRLVLEWKAGAVALEPSGASLQVSTPA